MPGRRIIQWILMVSLALPFAAHAGAPTLAAHYARALSMPADAPDLAEQLETLLRALRSAEDGAGVLMRDRARLRLAALYLAQGRFQDGRDQLRQIKAASPVAVTASLMMAESFRLDGDADAALQWYLLASRHFPHRPQTLSGLISAAHQLQQNGNDAAALALYSRTVEHVDQALQQLDALGGNIAPEVLLSPDSPLSMPVRETLLLQALAHPQIDLPRHADALAETTLRLLQLNTEQVRLARALDDMEELLARHQERSAAERVRLQTLDTQAASLRSQLVPGDFSDTQLALRKQLTQLDNERRRLQGELAFLTQTQTQAPALKEALLARSHNALQRTQQLLQQHHAAVDEVMTQTLASYRQQLQESGSEALLQQAEILRRHQRASPQ